MRSSHVSAAVDELVAEREHLVARLAKVDAAITAVREAFHLPPAARAPKPKRAPTTKAPQNGNGHGELHDNAILAALRSGPLSPGDLAARLGVERTRLRDRLVKLGERGFVRVTGSTTTRRIELTSAPPTKEAP